MRRRRLGRLLSTLGMIWLALFFLAGAGLFGSSQFSNAIRQLPALLPIAMMFVGRVIRRRATRTPVEPIEPVESIEPAAQPPPAKPPTAKPPTAKPPPEPLTMEQMAEAVQFEDIEPLSRETVAKPLPPTPSPDVEPMSSAEMVAEAKRRLSS